MIRQPIITILAHVDHGKTTLLDYIRHTTIAAKEAGGITQAIGTTYVPKDVIIKQCGVLLERFKIKVDVPGLLFIDTPGHAAFTTMRQRGGNIADIVVLLVDINEGFKPQTEESMEILKSTKTPFVVAVNKIDRLHGWLSKHKCFLDNYPEQTDSVKEDFEERFYKIVGQISNHGFDAERFDRIEDFRKKVAVIPVSAKTGEGVPELLTVLTGLAQQFLKNRLEVNEKCKGLVLEVKDVKGLGTTIDTVIYDGHASKNGYLVVGGKEPFVTKIKALLVPEPLRDIRTEKRFKQIDEVDAAMGVKIVAHGLENVVAGSDFLIVETEEQAEHTKEELKKELKRAEIKSDKGVILKADTLGSLEALITVFKGYPIKSASIGTVSKKDVIDAEANKDDFFKVVIGFNVPVAQDAEILAKDKKIKIFTSDVIYRLEEDYEKWKEQKQKELQEQEIAGITRPAKFRILPGCVFRACNPAIIGCEIVEGLLKPGSTVFKINNDSVKGEVKQIQSEGQNVDQAKKGDKVAVSITGIVMGRNTKEGDEFITDLEPDEYMMLKKYKGLLTDSEKTALEEIKNIKQSRNKFWGM